MTRFETELQVRPDDIDMNQHVHASRYLDYVLAARFDQMERCYQCSMPEFIKAGFGWVVQTAHVNFKRPLFMSEWFIVATWVEELLKDGVKVQFEMLRKSNRKVCSDGWFHYTMIDLKTGRAEKLPPWAVEKYSV